MPTIIDTPTLTAPSVPNVSSLAISTVKTSLAPSLSAIPTSAGGVTSFAANKLSIPTVLPPTGDALKTLAGAAGIPGVDLSLKSISGMTGITIPTFGFEAIPAFPGLDYPGLLLGKSKKFIAETAAKYLTISPPFIPGVKMNMAIVIAAASVLKISRVRKWWSTN